MGASHRVQLRSVLALSPFYFGRRVCLLCGLTDSQIRLQRAAAPNLREDWRRTRMKLSERAGWLLVIGSLSNKCVHPALMYFVGFLMVLSSTFIQEVTKGEIPK